jgi:hypothetical protein
MKAQVFKSEKINITFYETTKILRFSRDMALRFL